MWKKLENRCKPIAHIADRRVDMLRGLAALGVVFYHVRTDLWVGWAAIQASPDTFSSVDHIMSWFGVPMHFMGSGVLLFFIVSGYCIHRPQAAAGENKKLASLKRTSNRISTEPDTRQQTTEGGQLGGGGFNPASCQDSVLSRGPSWSRFYIRRFMRIYPPYLTSLILSGVTLAVTVGMSNVGWSRFWASVPMLQNYWGLGGQISTNPSLWSLPVEMELYLVYPLAWWLGSCMGWLRFLIIAILTSVTAQWVSLQGVLWLNGSFPNFWALWCAGACMAEMSIQTRLPNWHWGWGAFLITTTAAAAGTEMVPTLQGLSSWLWSGVGGLALFWAIAPRTTNAKPALKPGVWLAWIGTFSYSLYLIHYPMFRYAGWLWLQHFGSKPSNLLVALTAVTVVIPLAWLFHCLIELPSHRLARKIGAEMR
jgi:peptidoglycan/LPS O-acetylase OafA/YrhL